MLALVLIRLIPFIVYFMFKFYILIDIDHYSSFFIIIPLLTFTFFNLLKVAGEGQGIKLKLLLTSDKSWKCSKKLNE